MFDNGTKQKLLLEFKKLIKILEENKIWYSIIAGTLLGATQFKKMIPWDDDIDIMIKPEGYKKLKSLHPENIISSNEEGYPLFFPKWVPIKKDVHNSPIFIDLFVVVQTSKEKIKKFKSFRNRIRFGVHAATTNFRPFNISLKIWKYFAYLLKPFIKSNLDFDYWMNFLQDKTGNINMLIVNPIEDLKANGVPNFSEKTIPLTFEGFKVKGIKNAEEYFSYKYGQLNMNPPIGKKVWEHISAYNIRLKIWGNK